MQIYSRFKIFNCALFEQNGSLCFVKFVTFLDVLDVLVKFMKQLNACLRTQWRFIFSTIIRCYRLRFEYTTLSVLKWHLCSSNGYGCSLTQLKK